MQSFDYIHERHWYRQSNQSICDDNYFFDVEHNFHNDEQKTNFFEFHHEDHDLLKRNNETRSRFERNCKSSQKSSHNHLHKLSNCYSSHSMSQKTVRSIFAADINSKNKIMRSRNSHSLNLRSRWSLRQRSNRHNNQKNHWMKTIKSRFIDFRHDQF